MKTQQTLPSTATGELTEGIHCLLSDSRGQYIPRDFARGTKRDCISGVKPADLDYLARGPDGVCDDDLPLADGETERGEFYWDTWQDVCDNAIVTCPVSGRKFRLHQDGDLFLVSADWEWNDETEGFEPPESDMLMRFTLPAYWASYIANGDDSGISAEDKAQCDAFMQREELTEWSSADIGEQYFSWNNDATSIGGDVCRYTFIRIL